MSNRLRSFIIPVLSLLLGITQVLHGEYLWGQEPQVAETEVTYALDIRPIFSRACFKCHGFDEDSRQADLRLDTVDSVRELIAQDEGDWKGNVIWSRIHSDEHGEVMPPPEEKQQLSDKDLKKIEQWLRTGGEVTGHWAFESLNLDGQKQLTAKDIDCMLDRQIDRMQIERTSTASKETLIRRVALTLTGLPPSLEQVDAYLLDDTEGSYERMVDRYLASPHYGEEMARHWLDIARYGDTHGLHLDNERDVWPYRDWVVAAFNANQGFDQFSIEQIAGDLLEKPTVEQQVATGFNRCNVTTGEGGAIQEEFLFRYAVERASTTFQAWMGLTGGCAVCHDHKYDPISSEDFYSFYAFYYSAADPAMDGNRRDTPPYLKLPTQEQSNSLAKLKQQLKLAENELNEAIEAACQSANHAGKAREKINDVWLDDLMPDGASLRNTSRNPEQWVDSKKWGPFPMGHRALLMKYGHLHTQSINGGHEPRSIPAEPRLEFWLRPDSLHPPKAVFVELNTTLGKRRIGMGESVC